ncbi:phosphatidylserine decarboxylase [Thiobacter aerophilum]|uniref:Phosphatidylserine decarboxylase proenzyme n=1 Tax=Thiobacter aerophilum TaxID=3121275 RepID=A0ABV0EHJ1_9BURK
MSRYPHPIIAREGWPILAASLLVALLVHLLAGRWAAFPLWMWVVFVLQFFRDPPRVPAATGQDVVLSPADGRVIVVEHTTDPYRQVPARRISVFMNVFNAHSQRSPVAGTVEAVRYFPGAFVNAALDKASAENERNAVLMTTEAGVPVTVVQIAGLIARRILCYVKPGDRLDLGQRYGFIRFGSRLDVYLPPESTVDVTLGEKVYAGRTVLAHLPVR